MWCSIWKDRNVVPFLSTAFGVRTAEIKRGGGGQKKMGTLKPTNVPFGRYNYTAPFQAKPYNQFMGGTDVWDRMRLLHHYSLEKHVVCHKWWQKMFWGLFDACLANAYVCWKSVAPTKRTHIDFMHEVHQALVNNTFDEANCWGNKITPPHACTEKWKRCSQHQAKQVLGSFCQQQLHFLPI
jgi:hypothetical protein